MHATAKAVAKATAKALSAAWAGCDVTSDGFACADASTWIEETAYSVAVAYAELWAISLNCEGTCYVSVDTAVASLSTILVKAATDAYAHVCSGTLNPTFLHFSVYLFASTLLSCFFAVGILSSICGDAPGSQHCTFCACCTVNLHAE